MLALSTLMPDIQPSSINSNSKLKLEKSNIKRIKSLMGSQLSQPIMESRSSKSSIPIIVTTRPKLSGIDRYGYQREQVEFINIPTIPYPTSAHQPMINNPPKELPAFAYRIDPINGRLDRYLVMEDDDSDWDQEFGVNEEWMLFQRQGDQYNRIPEINSEPEAAYRESNSMLGYSIAIQGIGWNSLPRIRPTVSLVDPEFLDLLEYKRTQEQEEDNY